MPADPSLPSSPSSQPPPGRAPTERLAVDLALLAAELRCEDIVVLNLRNLSPACDYFLIATGTSDRQMRAVADAIDERAKAARHQRYGLAGYEHATWILIDYVDLVIHLFDQTSRDYYDLELLWGDAPRVEWSD